MKGFFKENVYRISILIILVAVSLLVAYYLFVSLPQTEKNIKNQNLVENQIKCKKAGEEYVKKEEADAPFTKNFIKEPEFKFSEDLNTCLVKRESFFAYGDGNISLEEFYIKDIYTNKTIAYYSKHYNLAQEVNDIRGNEEDYSIVLKKNFGL